MAYLPLQKILDDDLAREQAERKERGDYWYASEIGGCPRKAFYARKKVEGEPISPNSLRQMKAGGLAEVLVLERVADKSGLQVGEKKLVEAMREVQFNDEKLQIHGRADLVISYDDKSQEVVECKSMNSNGFRYRDKEGKASDHHEYQLWFYLYVAQIESGQFIYVSRDDLRMMQFPLTLSNQEVGDKVIKRIDYLNQHWADDKIPPPLEQEGGLCSPRWCPYYNLCKNIKKI